jgi:hypothetical protein
MGDKYANLPQSERERLNRVGAAKSEAARIGGHGFAMNKRALAAELARTTAADKIQQLRTSGTVDPSTSSAATSLRGLSLSTRTGFDDGIRAIKNTMRDASKADVVVGALQDEALNSHDSRHRHGDGRILGLPYGVAGLLQQDWNVLPHAFSSNLVHTRGSFPNGNETRGHGSCSKACN